MLFDDQDSKHKDSLLFPGETYGTTKGNGSAPVMDLDLPPPPSALDDAETGGVPMADGPRPKNFPPCYPRVHHNIKNDIDQERRMFVKRVYAGWWFHSISLAINMIVLIAGLIEGVAGLGSFLGGIAAVLVGPPLAFLVYFCLYTGVRKNSTLYFFLWFGCFGIQIGTEILFAIGLKDTVGAGFIGMIAAFNINVAVGVMYLVSTLAWIACACFNVYVFNLGRVEYTRLGGHRSAAKAFASAGARAAYDNRDTIADVARENKDAIRNYAVEHKDEIKDFAWKNKDVIGEVARDNQDLIIRTALENPDLVKSSKSEADNIFS